MQKAILLATLAALAGSPLAWAQGASSAVSKNSDKSGIAAPIGHRQPRVNDVPDEKNLGDPNDPTNKQDAAVDRKIKSICRGC